MAQLLTSYQDKYVPGVNKEGKKCILHTVPLHGDQLFEERSRNVIWTYRNGLNPYERFEGIDTEFAEWHAKYTLYKVTEQFTLIFHVC